MGRYEEVLTLKMIVNHLIFSLKHSGSFFYCDFSLE